MKYDMLCSSEIFRNSLYHASAEFHRQVTTDSKKNQKMEKSLYKYLSRAATRCTPFGRFAAVGTFHVTDSTCLERPNFLPMNSHLTIETAFLEKLALKLHCKEVLTHLTLRPNPTLFDSGKEYHYEARPQNSITRCYTVESTPILKAIVRLLKKHNSSEELYTVIKDEFEIDQDSFNNYLLQLIKSGIIITELIPQILNKECYLHTLITISKKSKTEDITRQLTECADFIYSINEKTANAIDTIEEFKQREWVKQLHKGDAQIVQCDSYLNACCDFSISHETVRHIEELLLLNRMLSTGGTPYALVQFRNRYETKYENSMQQLIKVLDEETGIGYGDMQKTEQYGMFKGLVRGGNYKPQSTFTLSKVQRMLLNVIESPDYNHGSIALEKYFKPDFTHELPQVNIGQSFNAMFQIIGDNRNEFEVSELRFCGPSALNLLARFTDGNTDIDKLCNEIATKESQNVNPDEILGEISHIPNSRSINVLHRKPWHKCSIEYLSPCENKTEILPISDLWIHIESGVIRLYSKTLKKYIVPRISSAHNHHNNCDVLYQFLGDLQSQHNGLTNVFTWGSLENLFSHLPRLTYKKIILSPEKWKIKIDSFKSKSNPDIDGLRKMLNDTGCPSTLLFREGDNCLWIDTSSNTSLSGLLDATRQRCDVWVEEFIAPSDRIGINECILPFIKNI
ncbi:hypothetical protein E5333_00010 [Muribaculum intestinale]|uniref:Lantibiotic dehydratase N-terminal domain-containing protein n=2 Tax=Muribaculum intestinale TaxID=1796646 RepID=A0A4S2G3Y2_9BACT|nr:hypothetical protein E5333_00010 [Muribaculum intestinale]